MSDFHGQPEGPQPTNRPIPPHMQQHNVVGNSPLAPKPPKRTGRTVLIVVASVVAGMIVTIGGCTALIGGALSSDEPAKQTSGAAPAVAETTAPKPTETTPPAVEETTPAPSPTDSGIASVGAKQWFTYTDGIQVQVTKLVRFKISSSAAGGQPGDVGVVATITIKNGSGDTFDTSLADVKLTAGPNGDEADQVFDSANNINGGFTGSIPNGRSKTAKVGFAVSKAHLSKLVVEVTPSWDHDASFFEGSVR